jgi:hypothetical protein
LQLIVFYYFSSFSVLLALFSSSWTTMIFIILHRDMAGGSCAPGSNNLDGLLVLVICWAITMMPCLSSGILPTWHKRVHTCLNDVYDMYVLCYSTCISYTWFRHVHTFLEMYRHVYTFLKMYKHVCTWYIHVYTFQV